MENAIAVDTIATLYGVLTVLIVIVFGVVLLVKKSKGDSSNPATNSIDRFSGEVQNQLTKSEKKRLEKLEQERQKELEEKQKIAEEERLVLTRPYRMVHISGLPLANVECRVQIDIDNSQISISSNGANFHLPLNRVISVDTTTSTEVQKSYTYKNGNALGGALVGGILLGPVGAVAGSLIGGTGKTQEHVDKTERYFFVISYTKDTNVNTIVFETRSNLSTHLSHDKYYTNVRRYDIVKLFKEYRKNGVIPTSTVSIEL